MSAFNNGGAAFPSVRRGEYDDVHPGMSLRDYFAAKAMHAVLSSDEFPPKARNEEALTKDEYADVIARSAYRMADSMLLARES